MQLNYVILLEFKLSLVLLNNFKKEEREVDREGDHWSVFQPWSLVHESAHPEVPKY